LAEKAEGPPPIEVTLRRRKSRKEEKEGRNHTEPPPHLAGCPQDPLW